MKSNLDVRNYAKKRSVALWEIAEGYGMADSNFSKLLRHELPEEKKKLLYKIIDELAAGRKAEQ